MILNVRRGGDRGVNKGEYRTEPVLRTLIARRGDVGGTGAGTLP